MYGINCTFGNGVYNNSPNLTVYCKPNSDAALYAIENDVPFLLIAADPMDYSDFVIDMDQTEFYTSASIAVVNNYVPLTLSYYIKNNQYSAISNPKIVISLSNGLELIEKSVMVNSSPVNYTYENGKLTIPISVSKGTIHLSVTPVTTGTMAAYAQFNYTSSSNKTERIGIVYLDIPLLTLFAPSQVIESSFEVSGITKPNEVIDIVFGETVLRSLTSKKDGTYTTSITLPTDLIAGKGYEIKAVLRSDNTVSATQTVIYRSDKPVLTQFDMYYYSHSLQKIDLLNAAGSRVSTEIYPGKPFKFVVRFDNSDSVDTVYITSTKNGITNKMTACPTSNVGEFIAEGYFDGTNEKTYVPGNINVHYTVHFTAEDFEVDLPYDELPIEWQNAVIEDTSTSEVKSGRITLENGAIVEYEVREGLTPYEAREMFLPSDDSPILRSRSASASEEDEALQFIINFFKDLGKKYKENVTSNVEDLAKEGQNGVAVIHDDLGERFRYVFWDPVKNTVETVGIKYVGTYFLQENSPGLSWSESGQAWGYIWAMGKTVVHTFNDVESVNETRANIRSSTTLSEEEKAYALDKMDKILLGYGAVNLLRMVSASVGYVLLATHPVAAVLIPFVMNEFISFADKYLGDAMDYYAAGGQGSYFRWIIDPSGVVFDPETGVGIPGVTVTAYCILLDENDPNFWDNPPSDTEYGELWDASEYSQQNPLLTGEDGSYSWDVPEGWWRVKFEKTGYETSWSQWMAVPPIQTEVDVELTQQEGFAISNTSSTSSSETFVITNNNSSSASVLIVIAAYDGSGNMITSVVESATIGSHNSSNQTLSYDSSNTSVIKVFILNPSTYAPVRNSWRKVIK